MENGRNLMKKLLAFVTVVFLMGCGTLHEEYVRADRSTFDLLAPKIEKWLEQRDED